MIFIYEFFLCMFSTEWPYIFGQMLEARWSSNFLHAAQGGKFEVGVDEVEMKVLLSLIFWTGLIFRLYCL